MNPLILLQIWLCDHNWVVTRFTRGVDTRSKCSKCGKLRVDQWVGPHMYTPVTNQAEKRRDTDSNSK